MVAAGVGCNPVNKRMPYPGHFRAFSGKIAGFLGKNGKDAIAKIDDLISIARSQRPNPLLGGNIIDNGNLGESAFNQITDTDIRSHVIN